MRERPIERIHSFFRALHKDFTWNKPSVSFRHHALKIVFQEAHVGPKFLLYLIMTSIHLMSHPKCHTQGHSTLSCCINFWELYQLSYIHSSGKHFFKIIPNNLYKDEGKYIFPSSISFVNFSPVSRESQGHNISFLMEELS